MEFSLHERYRILLAQCSKIQDPTLEQLQMICPHISRGQLINLHRVRKGYWEFALPPVQVRNQVQIAKYSIDPNTNTKYLIVDGSSRATAIGDRLILFQEEAKSYANQHWDHQLVERTWTDTMTVRLLHSGDPTHKNRTSEPLATVTLGLNCSWKVLQILANIPDTALWDDSIIIATTDFFEGCEIAGQPRNIVYNCAHCGGDYQRKSCQSCDISYPSIPIRDWLTPLPQKIIQLLESQGHSFASQFASP